jgi:hypothetical protein
MQELMLVAKTSLAGAPHAVAEGRAGLAFWAAVGCSARQRLSFTGSQKAKPRTGRKGGSAGSETVG